jgi:hypothetical protein
VLRATGKVDDAATLENEDLARALAAARIATNNSEQEAAVLAEEAERIINATVLAELLAPMLAEHLRPETVPATTPAVAMAPAIAEKTAPVVRPPAEKQLPSIADLIDGMLSQQAPFPASPVRR